MDVLITGATSGIGKIIAEKCLAKGYTVHAAGRNREALHDLSTKGANAIEADLSRIEDIKKLCDKLSNVDVAILNAGVGFFESVFDLADEQIDSMVNINIRSTILLSKYLSQKMIEKGKGHFIIIGSQAGKVPTKKASVYAASKHAITGFVNGLRMEMKDYGIKVTGIYPGPINTPFLDKADSTGTYRDSMDGFLLDPEKVAHTVVRAIEKPVREKNLPAYMNITSKLYALAPFLTETLGKKFFNKK